MHDTSDEIRLIQNIYDAICEVGIDSTETKRAVNYALSMYLAEHIDEPQAKDD